MKEVHDALIALSQENTNLFWLPATGMLSLGNDTVLVGQDGWADGRLGDYANSRVVLNDSRLIADLFAGKMLGKFQLLAKMQEFADKDAQALKQNLMDACRLNPKKIIVLTHMPPFREACMHQGKISDDEWLPFFGCKIMGDVLMDIAQHHPDINFLVLCGHTHSKAVHQPLGNLTIKVGDAEYYQPKVQEVIE